VSNGQDKKTVLNSIATPQSAHAEKRQRTPQKTYIVKGLPKMLMEFRNSFNGLVTIVEWARSPVWIKAPAFGAGDSKKPDTRGSNPCGPAILYDKAKESSLAQPATANFKHYFGTANTFEGAPKYQEPF
jgi:hypothetical protein